MVRLSIYYNFFYGNSFLQPVTKYLINQESSNPLKENCDVIVCNICKSFIRWLLSNVQWSIYQVNIVRLTNCWITIYFSLINQITQPVIWSLMRHMFVSPFQYAWKNRSTLQNALLSIWLHQRKKDTTSAIWTNNIHKLIICVPIQGHSM